MVCDVCPWWLAYTLDNRVRRWIHKPGRIFEKYAKPGMTVLDLGCGMGFSALPLARIVGDGGCVIAVDIQRKTFSKSARPRRGWADGSVRSGAWPYPSESKLRWTLPLRSGCRMRFPTPSDSCAR